MDETRPEAIDDLVEAACGVLRRCRLDGPGQYKRWAVPVDFPDAEGLNPYAVADAANLRYTLDLTPRDPAERAGYVAALRSMQDPQSGLFSESTHHQYHTTAHCLAALELFDTLPEHPLTAMEEDATPEGVVARLEGLDWVGNPWGQSHQGAGVWASLKLARQMGAEQEAAWQSAYFDWLRERFDPETGLLRRGCLPGQAEGSKPTYQHMAGTFHYLFNMHHARVPMPYPERLVDACLEMFEDRQATGIASSVGFITVDWVFCIHRAFGQCGHRPVEVRAALGRVAGEVVAYLRGIDHERHERFNDLHNLFGIFCGLAELQLALPGRLTCRRALRQVLDRRPFI